MHFLMCWSVGFIVFDMFNSHLIVSMILHTSTVFSSFFALCSMDYCCVNILADFLLITFYVQIDLFKHFREDVSLRLWNSDFKRQIDGIELLQKVGNLDVN